MTRKLVKTAGGTDVCAVEASGDSSQKAGDTSLRHVRAPSCDCWASLGPQGPRPLVLFYPCPSTLPRRMHGCPLLSWELADQ